MATRLHEVQAEAEAARREAAEHRKAAKRLAPSAHSVPEGASTHALSLLQKRVKVLEAQNARLRAAAGAGSASKPVAFGVHAPLHKVAPHGHMYGWSEAGAGHSNGSSSAGSLAGELGSEPEADAQASVAKWRADKKLLRKVEALQVKIVEREREVSAAKEEARRQLARTEEAQAVAEALRVERAAAEARARAAESRAVPGAVVPAAKAKALLRELEDLQQRYDALERQLAALQRQQQQQQPAAVAALWPPHKYPANAFGNPVLVGAGDTKSAPDDNTSVYDASISTGIKVYCPEHRVMGTSDQIKVKAEEQSAEAALKRTELALLDATMERDQAAARAVRLQRRLDLLVEDVTLSSSAASSFGNGGGGHTESKPGGRGTAPLHKESERERELLDTVELLKSALERAKRGLEGGVSNSKYMAAVEKTRRLAARVSELESQVAAVEGRAHEAEAAAGRAAELSASVAALKSQLRAARQLASNGTRAREESMNAQVTELERAVVERDLQLAALQGPGGPVAEARALLQEGLTPRDLVEQLLQARSVSFIWNRPYS
jgi:hypothetical protein